MKSVFKRIYQETDCLFEQKAIDEDEQTPEGWVDNIEDLDLPSGDNSDEKDQEKEEQKDIS